jgi:SAM-dependent methyltransferase
VRDAFGVLERARTSLSLRALDLADRVRGRSDRLVPPRRHSFVGGGDFVATGDEFLGHFVELGGLRPGDAVLDIGCGIGRMARPLTRYLSADGTYEGFDVSREGIDWCRRHYRPHPNFRFRHADLYNAEYNPRGAIRATDFRFPYDDGSFDLAAAISVFTHLLPDDAARYVSEAARVLAPGGRMLATWFLLDADSRRGLARGAAALPFRDRDDHTAVINPEVPEEAIAYDAGWVAGRLSDRGLAVRGVWPGTWSGKDDGRSFQDIVVAEVTA